MTCKQSCWHITSRVSTTPISLLTSQVQPHPWCPTPQVWAAADHLGCWLCALSPSLTKSRLKNVITKNSMGNYFTLWSSTISPTSLPRWLCTGLRPAFTAITLAINLAALAPITAGTPAQPPVFHSHRAPQKSCSCCAAQARTYCPLLVHKKEHLKEVINPVPKSHSQVSFYPRSLLLHSTWPQGPIPPSSHSWGARSTIYNLQLYIHLLPQRSGTDQERPRPHRALLGPAFSSYNTSPDPRTTSQ